LGSEKHYADKPLSSVLLINIRLIGDVILSTPIVGMLKDRWPGIQIDYLVNRGTGEWLEKDPRIREVIYHEPKESGLETGQKSSYFWKIFRKYDMAFDMNGSDRGAFASAIAGRRIRGSFLPRKPRLGNIFKRLLLTHAIDFPYESHMAEMSAKVMEALGEKPSGLNVKIYWKHMDSEKVENEISKINRDSYLVLHPFARWEFKQVELDILAQAAIEVARARSLDVVVTSGPEEREKELLDSMTFPSDLGMVKIFGAFDLNQIACLISGSKLYIGLDTAVTHIAASTGTPVVALYGPTPLWRWGPWCNGGEPPQYPVKGKKQNGNIMVIQRDWDCVSCGRKGCDDSMVSRCLENISPMEIVDACNLMLGC
jgi:heptosyltransferase-3